MYYIESPPPMSWDNVYSGATLGCVSGDGDTVYLYNPISGSVFVSTDGGYNYGSAVYSPAGTTVVSMCTNNTGQYAYLVPQTGQIAYTSNYGTDWAVVDGINLPAWTVISCDETGANVVATGYNGEEYEIYSTNNYSDFGLLVTGLQALDITVTNVSVIYVISGQYAARATGVNDSNPTQYNGLPGISWTRSAASADGAYVYMLSTMTTARMHYTSDGNNTSAEWNPAEELLSVGEFYTSISCDYTGQYVAITTSDSAGAGKFFISTNFGAGFIQRETTNQWMAGEIAGMGPDAGQIVVGSAYQDNSTYYIYLSTDGGISCMVEGTQVRMCADAEPAEVHRKLVQDIQIGDMVWTTQGEKRVIFVGSSSTRNPNHVLCLPQDSVSPGVPNQDLALTYGHSLFFSRDAAAEEAEVSQVDMTHVSPHFKQLFPLDSEYYDVYRTAFVPDKEKYRLLMRDCTLCTPFHAILPGTPITYYHIVLESDDPEECFIIDTNGMLSESMPRNHIERSELVAMPSTE